MYNLPTNIFVFDLIINNLPPASIFAKLYDVAGILLKGEHSGMLDKTQDSKKI